MYVTYSYLLGVQVQVLRVLVPPIGDVVPRTAAGTVSHKKARCCLPVVLSNSSSSSFCQSCSSHRRRSSWHHFQQVQQVRRLVARGGVSWGRMLPKRPRTRNRKQHHLGGWIQRLVRVLEHGSRRPLSS